MDRLISEGDRVSVEYGACADCEKVGILVQNPRRGPNATGHFCSRCYGVRFRKLKGLPPLQMNRDGPALRQHPDPIGKQTRTEVARVDGKPIYREILDSIPQDADRATIVEVLSASGYARSSAKVLAATYLKYLA